VHAILPPLSLCGPALNVRKFAPMAFVPEQLVRVGTLGPRALAFLAACVRGRANIVVSGATSSGKTTLLGVLSTFISPEERIVTIEDAAELRLANPHVLGLESRPANVEGRGEVTVRDLVRNALRMRPDRIVVGEVRGGEALDMLQAMNTGHEGSLGTIHANSPREALSRLETLVLFAGTDLPPRAIREQIVHAIRVVIQVSRTAGGHRRVTSISELSGMEGEQFTTGEIFQFDATPGQEPFFRATGYVPRCRDLLVERGQQIDNAWFRS
jgi:pilus assembly protein CpaF